MTELSMPGFTSGDRITHRDDRSLTGTYAGVRLDRDRLGVECAVADIVWDEGVEGPEYLYYPQLRHILPEPAPAEGAASVMVEYLHRYEYQTLDAEGNWSEPEIRYHNSTSNENRALHRHEECKDYEYRFGHRFEGNYGYRVRNDVLVKRTTVTTRTEEEL